MTGMTGHDERDVIPFYWGQAVPCPPFLIVVANSFDKTKGTSVYPVDSYNLTQTYKFHDPATMASDAEEIIPGNAGPFTITEAVIADSNSPSGYSYQVTKDGQPSLPIPLP